MMKRPLDYIICGAGDYAMIGRKGRSRFRACLAYARELGKTPSSLPVESFVRYGMTPQHCDFDGPYCYFETKPGKGAIPAWIWGGRL